jgi:folate-binding protein YgfZ
MAIQETIQETIEPVSVNMSPLDEVHRQSGATMIERDGWSVPSSYGDVLFEYAAVRERGAGLIDLSSRGRLLVSGSEAVQFLNGLITNDMKTLAENHWMPAAFPNVQGRLLASVRVVRQSSHQLTSGFSSFLIDTEPATHAQVRKTIERFTLAGDFHLTDLTGQTALLSIQGTDAKNIIRTLFGDSAGGLEPHQLISTNWAQTSLTIIRASHTAANGFDLIIDAKSAAALWTALIGASARPVGFDALEILRLEAGQPRFGIDMDETNVVSETGLDDAVSFTKGCYLGQEIIARIKYRGHVAKKLSGLMLEPMAKIERDAKINFADGKEIGRVTSVTFSPHLGSTIALGYLKYDYLSPGTEVMVSAGDDVLPARVVALPFLK